jgi:hypothetical protein
MRRLLGALLLVPLLAACGADAVFAPMEEVAARAYREDGPPTLTLLTAINNRNDRGGHSALMVSGSQRVLFDPAGTWWHPNAPERGDVKFGMTPTMVDFYVDYHARPEYRLVLQEITVPPDVAEDALRLVQAHGPANKATCGRSVSGILRALGFEDVRRSWAPEVIMRDFAALPQIRQTVVRDHTDDPHSPSRSRYVEAAIAAAAAGE